MREFNSTGLCVPRKHYMVDISGRELFLMYLKPGLRRVALGNKVLWEETI